MAQVFISYARQDKERVRVLADYLSSEGYEVWWDFDLTAGSDFAAEISSQLRSANCILVMWSASSIVSRWVRDEAAFGLEKGILIPLLVDSIEIPLGFRGVHAEDLRNWNGSPDAMSWLNIKKRVEEYCGNPRYERVDIQQKRNGSLIDLMMMVGILVLLVGAGFSIVLFFNRLAEGIIGVA